MKTLLAGITCLFLCTLAPNTQAEVQLPHGEFFKNIDDLQVKVMGGKVKVGRTYYKGAWIFNRTWAPLTLNIPTGDSSDGDIDRNDTKFSYTNASRRSTTMSDGSIGYHVEFIYNSNVRKTERYIRRGDIAGSTPDSDAERTVSQIRWENTAGDWIDYQLTSNEAVSARATAYGNHTGTIASFAYDTENRLAGILDRSGTQVVWYEYNAQGELQYVRDVENHQVEYRYTNGQLSEVIDVRGNSWLYGYNNGLLGTITDPEGRTTEVVHDNAKRVAKVILRDNNGNRVETNYRFDYDKTKKEYYVQEKDPLGSVTESWYNSSSQLIRKSINGTQTYTMIKDTQGGRDIRTITDRRGLKTVKEYDQWENLVKTTYPDNSITSAAFKPATNLPTERIDELGRITQYEYDNSGNLKKLTEAVGTPVQRTTEYRYNADGLRIEKKVLADSVSLEANTGYDYDPQGSLKTLTGPEGGETKFTYNIRGDVLTRVDPNDKTWRYTYDAAGNLESQTDPLTHSVTLEYDKVGNLTASEDRRKHTTRYTYNLQDKRITQTDPLTHETEMGYDDAGRQTSIKEPLGNLQTIDYDLEGRPISQKDPAGNATTQGYGEGTGQGGGLNGATNYPGLLNRTQYPTYLQTYDYDKRGRRTQTIDHLDDGPAITVTKYDLAGNRIETTDAENRVTKYRYDALNRLVEIIDPLQQSTRFSYDNRDNLLSVTDPNTHTTHYTYDRADRETSEIRPGPKTTIYTYDAAGNLKTVTDPDGRKTVNDYDDAGRLEQQEHYLPGATTPERIVTYDYDNNNNLTGYSDGKLSVSAIFDENNRKIQEATNYGTFSLSHSYTYDAAGNKQTYTGPDSTTVTYHWDKGRLSRIELPSEGDFYFNSYKWTKPDKITWPGGSTREISYTADLKPTRLLDKDPGDNPLLDYQYTYDKTGNIEQKATQNQTYIYKYDPLQRLTEAASQAETEAWNYDPNGNRTSDKLNPGTWHYDDSDRLTQSPTTTYIYDNTGHTTSKTEGAVTTSYSYNAEGRLSRIEDVNQITIAEYAYDPLGRRYQKATQTDSLYFYYTDEGLVGEYDNAGNPIRLYGYAPDSNWTTNPLYQKTGQGYAYYQNDHLGTPQQLIRKNGAKVWSGEYRAFGELRSETGSWGNRLRFPGQYFDEETGNYYNYHRTYDSVIGRYTTQDPIGIDGGMNTYNYALSNPIRYIDVEGKNPAGIIIGVCLRFPRLCTAVMACISHPRACTKAMCKATCKAYQIVCKSDFSNASKNTGGGGCSGSEGCALTALKCIHFGSCCLLRSACNLCAFAGMGHPDKKTGKRSPKDQATAEDCSKAKKCCIQAVDKCGDCFE